MWVNRLKNSIDPISGKQAAQDVYVVFPGEGRKAKRTKILDTPKEDWGIYQNFFIWFILCGRGFGKSWTGSSWINEGAEKATGEYMGLLGRDAHDVRAFMVEGDSGILRTARPDFYPNYEPSKRLITWPNGVKANIFYAEEPNTVRGPNNFRAWADEPASYQDAKLGLNGPNGEDTAMSNLLMTLRIGNPQLLVTGTPKPLKLIKDLMNYEGAIIVRGGTRENRNNLSARWLSEMEKRYEGTRLGKQELDGEILDDNPSALWRRAWIERDRVTIFPICDRIVVGVDPMGSTASETAETGIVAAGRWYHPGEGRYHFYIFEDDSIHGSPREWGTAVITCHNRTQADAIVVEKNFGGDMCRATIENISGNVRVIDVTASRSKYIRAEPISALYEQGRVHHVGNPKKFEFLEDEMCDWDPNPEAKMPSPNRLDALVWALTELSEIGLAEVSDEDYSNFYRQE